MSEESSSIRIRQSIDNMTGLRGRALSDGIGMCQFLISKNIPGRFSSCANFDKTTGQWKFTVRTTATKESCAHLTFLQDFPDEVVIEYEQEQPVKKRP